MRVLSLSGNPLADRNLAGLVAGRGWPELVRLNLDVSPGRKQTFMAAGVMAVLEGGRFPRLISLTLPTMPDPDDLLARLVCSPCSGGCANWT